MSDCSSLENLLNEIDRVIADYDYKSTPRYLDNLKQQAQNYRRAADYMNQAADRIARSSRLYDVQ